MKMQFWRHRVDATCPVPAAFRQPPGEPAGADDASRANVRPRHCGREVGVVVECFGQDSGRSAARRSASAVHRLA